MSRTRRMACLVSYPCWRSKNLRTESWPRSLTRRAQALDVEQHALRRLALNLVFSPVSLVLFLVVCLPLSDHAFVGAVLNCNILGCCAAIRS